MKKYELIESDKVTPSGKPLFQLTGAIEADWQGWL